MHPRVAANSLPQKQSKQGEPLDGRRLSEIRYRLHVMTRIRSRDLHTIYESGPELIQLIENGGVHLELSSVLFGDGDTVDIYNYWDLASDANQLFELELTIPDEPAYARFDRLIVEETKDIMVPATEVLDGGKDPRAIANPVYLRASYRLETTTLPEFVARMESSAFPFGRDNGWILKAAEIGLTGRSNQIVQTWIIPHGMADTARHRLMTAAWQELSEQPPACQILAPTPSDPTLGTVAAAHRMSGRRRKFSARSSTTTTNKEGQ